MADSKDNPSGLKLFNGLLVQQDRLKERTQGCWNCMHTAPAKEWWSQKRQEDLQNALAISHESLLGEEDPKAKNIRIMVDQIDRQVAQGIMARCGKNPKGKTALGEPVGDLVHTAFLCNGWSAAQGASIARAGQKADKLPEELMVELDGDDVVRKRPLN